MRSRMSGQRTPSSVASMPYLAAWVTVLATSAAYTYILVGMQPTLMQVPPNVPDSMIATLLPSKSGVTRELPAGNSLVTPDFDGKRVAIIESGTFGGTCINVGCIPTKMYVYAADVANTITHAARYGIDATLDGVRWTDIRDRIFGRVDPISESGKDYRVNGRNTTAFLGHATFTGPNRLQVDTRDEATGVETRHEVTADQIVIAAGAHPDVPTAIAQADVPFHTSDTVMRLDELPRRLLILGSGFIAACLLYTSPSPRD